MSEEVVLFGNYGLMIFYVSNLDLYVMSVWSFYQERKPYVKEAAYVNFLYDKALRQGEADQFPKVLC